MMYVCTTKIAQSWLRAATNKGKGDQEKDHGYFHSDAYTTKEPGNLTEEDGRLIVFMTGLF